MRALVITNDSTVFRYDEAKAEEMFGGRLTEVRNLKTDLSKICKSEFAVISGEYGLVPGDKVIKKYSDVPDSLSEYLRTEKETRFSDAISELSKSFEATLIFVPKEMMRIILKRELYGFVIAVTNSEFQDELKRRGIYYLERKGARVGRENSETICEIISSVSTL